MKLLVDTQAYVVATEDEARLGRKARRRLADATAERLFSIASAWELAIKISLGKLRLSLPLAEHLERGMHDLQLHWLPIALEHAVAVTRLPRHHGDPFDRMLVAQAEREGCRVVSSDAAFDAYGIERIW